MMSHTKDYLIVSVIGLAFGLFLIPVLSNIKLPFLTLNIASASLITIFFIAFANVALWIAFVIGTRIPVVLQFAKFAAVGAFSTLFAFGILNVLIALTKVTSGIGYSAFIGLAFICATTGSYFLNRYWTFSIQNAANTGEFGKFLSVSVVGFAVNVGIASFVVNVVSHPAVFTPERWANLGALSATVISLIWNFFGYKFIVFKRSTNS